jgi:hypothetical protein
MLVRRNGSVLDLIVEQQRCLPLFTKALPMNNGRMQFIARSVRPQLKAKVGMISSIVRAVQ